MKHFPFGLAGFAVAVAAAGVAGDLLLRVGPMGMNVTILCGAVLGLVAFEARRSGLLKSVPARVTLAAAAAFSIAYAWRDANPLSLLLLAVIGVSVVLLASARVGRDPRSGYLWDYGLYAINFGIWAIRLPFVLMFRTHNAVKTTEHNVAATGFAALRGVLIAAPLVVVFGALLMSADALFERFVSDLIYFDVETVFSHAVLFVLCAWTAAVIWWQCLEGGVGEPVFADGPRKTFGRGVIEINVALGLVTLLFASFIAVQARYFFGGHERVLTEAGLTYADYARRGFFELATVAAFALGLLVACSRLVEAADPRGRRVYTIIAGVFIAAVLIIVASAFHRMSLYINAYGLTRLRLYTAAFMIWMAVVFVWLFVNVRGDRLARFAWGCVLTGYIATFALVAVNPDALIARVNVARALDGKALDFEYLDTLSADAIPPLVDALPRLSADEQVELSAFLDKRTAELRERPVRTWNLGAFRARVALRSVEDAAPSR